MKASSKCRCKHCNAKLVVIVEDSESKNFAWDGVIAGIEEKAWKKLLELHSRHCSKTLQAKKDAKAVEEKE